MALSVASSILICPELAKVHKDYAGRLLDYFVKQGCVHLIDDQLLTLLWLKGQELITTGVRVCSCFMQSLSIASEQNFCSLTIADSFFISEILPAISAILYQCCDS